MEFLKEIRRGWTLSGVKPNFVTVITFHFNVSSTLDLNDTRRHGPMTPCRDNNNISDYQLVLHVYSYFLEELALFIVLLRIVNMYFTQKLTFPTFSMFF